MTDPFHDSKYSVRWANEHIRNFEREEASFLNKNPYELIVEKNSNNTLERHVLKLVKQPPWQLRGMGSDACINLRAALDQAMFAVSTLAKVKPCYFIIRDDQTAFDRDRAKPWKDIPADIVKFLCDIQPYKRGENLLWALNKITGTNKHATIKPVAAVSHTIAISVQRVRTFGASLGIRSMPVWDRTNNEMELIVMPIGCAYEPQFQFAKFIAICDVEFVDGNPAVAVLDHFASIVNRIVMGLEAEAKRIGLV